MRRNALNDPRFYLNRHIQWLAFNRRVLEEAQDIGNPLLERVKFLAITANNLDEFVEVRVSSFLQRIEHGSREISPDGLTVVSWERKQRERRKSFMIGASTLCSRRLPWTPHIPSRTF
jgi:polyphosphate kinase